MGACPTCLRKRNTRKVEDSTVYSELRRQFTVAILGLDNAGKTAVVKALKGEPSGDTVPTIGFINEEIAFKGDKVTVFDLGGGPRIRAIWKNYFPDVHGIVYVVDSSETGKLDEARQELKSVVLDKRMKGKPCLILANKQDRSGATNVELTRRELHLEELFEDHSNLFNLFGCCAISRNHDDSVSRAFQWLMVSMHSQFDALNERVRKDLEQQRERQERERRERLERVRIVREQRDAEEAALRAESGNVDVSDEVELIQNQDPFKRLDIHQFGDTMQKDSSMKPVLATRLEERPSIETSFNVASAVAASRPDSAGDTLAVAAESPRRDSAVIVISEMPEDRLAVSLAPHAHAQLPPLQHDRAKHKKRQRVKRNQTEPTPANGHASLPILSSAMRRRSVGLTDIFEVELAANRDEKRGNQENQARDNTDQDSPSLWAPDSQPSTRNPKEDETVGQLESDSDYEAESTSRSLPLPTKSSPVVLAGIGVSSSPSVAVNSRVAEFLADAMALEPNEERT